MQDGWWYAIEDTRKGPVSLEHLRELLIERKVSEGTLVWREGLDNWGPLSEVPELNNIIKSIPPDLPKLSEVEKLTSLPPAGPWRRFFARSVDMWVIVVPMSIAAVYVGSTASAQFSSWIQQPVSQVLFGWLLTPLILLIEALIYALFGTTPGKTLLGVVIGTTNRQPLSAKQYLQRLIGVYWYGYATGIPIISLFTLARQRSHLKSGRQATYDEGKYQAKAHKLSVARALLASAIVIIMFLVNVALQPTAPQPHSEQGAGATWTNQITGKQLTLPSGWTHEVQENEQQHLIHIFSRIDEGVYVIFANEEVMPDLDLQTYVDYWVDAVSNEMSLSTPGQQTLVDSYEGLTVTGSLTNDPSQLVQATLVMSGQQAWRVVILSSADQHSVPESAMSLQNMLFRSVE